MVEIRPRGRRRICWLFSKSETVFRGLSFGASCVSIGILYSCCSGAFFCFLIFVTLLSLLLLLFFILFVSPVSSDREVWRLHTAVELQRVREQGERNLFCTYLVPSHASCVFLHPEYIDEAIVFFVVYLLSGV